MPLRLKLRPPRTAVRRDSMATGPPNQLPSSARLRSWPPPKRTAPASFSTGGRPAPSGMDASRSCALTRHRSGCRSSFSPRASASMTTEPASFSSPCSCNARRNKGAERSPCSVACSRGAPFARPIHARRDDGELVELTAVEQNLRAAARELDRAASGRESRQVLARHGEPRDFQRAGGARPVHGVLTRRRPASTPD